MLIKTDQSNWAPEIPFKMKIRTRQTHASLVLEYNTDCKNSKYNTLKEDQQQAPNEPFTTLCVIWSRAALMLHSRAFTLTSYSTTSIKSCCVFVMCVFILSLLLKNENNDNDFYLPPLWPKYLHPFLYFSILKGFVFIKGKLVCDAQTASKLKNQHDKEPWTFACTAFMIHAILLKQNKETEFESWKQFRKSKPIS